MRTAITSLATQFYLRFAFKYRTDSINCIAICPAQLYRSNSYPSPYLPRIPGNLSFVTPFVHSISIQNTGLCCFNFNLCTTLLSAITRASHWRSYPTTTATYSLSQSLHSHPTHSPTSLRVPSLPSKTTCLTPGFVSAHQLTLVPRKLSMSRALGTPNVRFLTAFGHILNHSPPIHTPATAFSAYFATETSLVRLLASACTRNLHLFGLYTCICS